MNDEIVAGLCTTVDGDVALLNRTDAVDPIFYNGINYIALLDKETALKLASRLIEYANKASLP